MSHLSTERLALLCDEPPTPTELAHLAACDTCARERRAYAAVRALAAPEDARIDTPITDWDRLRPALAADGIFSGGDAFRGRSRANVTRWLSQAAAAVLLVAGGVVGGRLTAPARSQTVASTAAATSAPAADSQTAIAIPVQYHTLDEARTAQTQFQSAYQAATAFIAQHDTTGPAVMSSAAMRTRLAALDHVSQAVGEALDEAPYDPVINGYYLTTLGQREATLRQLNTVLPVGMRITSY
jgi:hypothetical protein